MSESLFIFDADLAEKEPLKAKVANWGCCANISEKVTPYYSFIPKDKIRISRELLINWVDAIIAEGLPISRVRDNDIVAKNWRQQKVLLYSNCKSYELFLNNVKKAISAKKPIIVKGTKKGQEYYNYTHQEMLRGEIVEVDSSQRIVIKILNHKHDTFEGETAIVHPLYFTHEDGTPLLDEKVLKKEEFGDKQVFYPGYLVRVDVDKVKNTERLFIHTLLRFAWHESYSGFIESYFNMKKDVPEADFFELLVMVSVAGNYSGGNGICQNPEHANYFRKKKDILTDLRKGSAINTSFTAPPMVSIGNYSEIQQNLRGNNVRKAYEDLLYASYGKKNKEVLTAVSIQDYGELTKGNKYIIRNENERSYKVLADDYCERWYRKARFSNLKTEIE